MEDQIRNMEHVYMIDVNANIDMNFIYDVTELVTRKLQDDPLISDIVINLKNQFTVKQDSIRGLSSYSLELRKKAKKLYLLNMGRELKDMVVKMALDDLLAPLEKVEQIAQKPVKKKAAVDVNFLNPFIEGTMKTLKLQCQMDCTPKAPAIKGPKFSHPVDIAGVIGVTSKGFVGSIAICFPEKIFLKIMSNMLGEEYSQIDDELEDGAGELLNIIFGHAKKVLNQTGHSLDKAIPTIVRGSALNVRHISNHACFIIPFVTEYGTFYIEISAEV